MESIIEFCHRKLCSAVQYIQHGHIVNWSEKQDFGLRDKAE